VLHSTIISQDRNDLAWDYWGSALAEVCFKIPNSFTCRNIPFDLACGASYALNVIPVGVVKNPLNKMRCDLFADRAEELEYGHSRELSGRYSELLAEARTVTGEIKLR
jgi:hypothetical protein